MAYSTLADTLKGTYKPINGVTAFEVVKVIGTSRKSVVFKDGSAVPAALLTEMLLRKEIRRV